MEELKKQYNTPDVRRARFKKLAALRTRKVIKSLDILGNCSNRTNYAYEDGEVEKIFSAIQAKLTEVRIRFKKREKGSNFEL